MGSDLVTNNAIDSIWQFLIVGLNFKMPYTHACRHCQGIWGMARQSSSSRDRPICYRVIIERWKQTAKC